MDRRFRNRIGGRLVLALLLMGGVAVGKSVILLETAADRATLENAQKEAKSMPGIAPKVEKGTDGYRLFLGPLPSDEETAALYYRLKKEFPSAVILEKGESTRPRESVKIAEWLPDWIGGSSSDGVRGAEEYRPWIALFALAITGVLGRVTLTTVCPCIFCSCCMYCTWHRFKCTHGY